MYNLIHYTIVQFQSQCSCVLLVPFQLDLGSPLPARDQAEWYQMRRKRRRKGGGRGGRSGGRKERRGGVSKEESWKENGGEGGGTMCI